MCVISSYEIDDNAESTIVFNIKELLWLVGIIEEEKEVPGNRNALSSP